jgi:hypothetical protein
LKARFGFGSLRSKQRKASFYARFIRPMPHYKLRKTQPLQQQKLSPIKGTKSITRITLKNSASVILMNSRKLRLKGQAILAKYAAFQAKHGASV